MIGLSLAALPQHIGESLRLSGGQTEISRGYASVMTPEA